MRNSAGSLKRSEYDSVDESEAEEDDFGYTRSKYPLRLLKYYLLDAKVILYVHDDDVPNVKAFIVILATLAILLNTVDYIIRVCLFSLRVLNDASPDTVEDTR